MENTKKTHPIFRRMVKLFKSRLFRGIALLGLLAVSFLTMLMMDEGNWVRDKHFSFLNDNFLQGFMNGFNVTMGAWIIYFCVLFAAVIFTIGSIFAPAFVKKMSERNPLNVNDDSKKKTVYSVVFYTILLLFCGIAVLIAALAGAFDDFGTAEANVFTNLLLTLLICILFVVVIGVALCVLWLIAESIIYLCTKSKAVEDAKADKPVVSIDDNAAEAEASVTEETVAEEPAIEEPASEPVAEEKPVEAAPVEAPAAFSANAFGNRAVKRSFAAKLCQSEEAVKEYYSELKNYLLSYKKVNSRVSFNYDSFNFGRPNIAKLALKGKTLVLYLSLKYEDYAGSKYHPNDASAIKKYENTPMYVKVKSARGVKFAKELIDIVLDGEPKKANPHIISYVVPFKNDDQLVSEGHIKIIEKK